MLINSGIYSPFSEVTRNALRHALAEQDASLSDDAIAALMGAYDELSTFSDVEPTLNRLAECPTVKAVVFSNGTQEMVSHSVRHSPDLSPHAAVFADIITVDGVKQYKPSPDVYYHLAKEVGKEDELQDIWLVSGNPFDIVGARSVGMNAVWVYRGGRGWTDAAVPGLSPTVAVTNLEDIVGLIQDA